MASRDNRQRLALITGLDLLTVPVFIPHPRAPQKFRFPTDIRKALLDRSQHALARTPQ